MHQIPNAAALTLTNADGRQFLLTVHLRRLESESIEMVREVVAEFKKPVMLYSMGKDSSVILHLARKAFYPAPLRRWVISRPRF